MKTGDYLIPENTLITRISSNIKLCVRDFKQSFLQFKVR